MIPNPAPPVTDEDLGKLVSLSELQAVPGYEDGRSWNNPADEESLVRKVRLPIEKKTHCIMLFGKRGSGKSAAMAGFGKSEAQAGRNVWYWPPDYRFRYGTPIDAQTLYSLPEWLNNGVILIDEIQVLMNRARTVSTANLMGAAMLQQMRKRGLDIIGTSNSPMRLDSAVSQQTTMHAYCEKFDDPRCVQYGEHIPDCRDAVKMNFVDTNMEHGADYRHWDGRKRWTIWHFRLRKIYPIYNTGAIADIGEVISMTKDQIVGDRSDEKAGMSAPDLVEALRKTWVPWMVNDRKVSTVAVASFTAMINETQGLKLDPGRVGKALRDLGLPSRSNGKSRLVHLPPADRLVDWQHGFYNPADDM